MRPSEAKFKALDGTIVHRSSLNFEWLLSLYFMVNDDDEP